jgi:hypothetical protein
MGLAKPKAYRNAGGVKEKGAGWSAPQMQLSCSFLRRKLRYSFLKLAKGSAAG